MISPFMGNTYTPLTTTSAIRRVLVASFGVSVLCISFGAGADVANIQWKDGAFAHKATIAPGKVLESCGKLVTGERVTWNFKSSQPAEFNIHYHTDKEVTYAEPRKESAGTAGTLQVTSDQDYCWMWRNKSAAPVEVEVSLKNSKPAAR
ncbi:MAG: hypothetical protein ABI905_14340 [Betaproteobacteria bacterium]